MPTEWPPKKPEPAPKPSGPDAEAVRKALAEIERLQKVGAHVHCLWEARVKHALIFERAARAWLAEQDGNNQHTRGPVDCRGMKGASE